jgi:hypothetical protein
VEVEMKKRARRSIIAMVVLALALDFSFQQTIEARTVITSIVLPRGRTRSWIVSPGDPDEIQVWYYTDGKSATASLWTSAGSQILFGPGGVPFIVLTTYYYPKGKSRVQLDQTSIDPFGRNISMSRTTGQYLLSIKIKKHATGDGWGHLDNIGTGEATGLSVKIK